MKKIVFLINIFTYVQSSRFFCIFAMLYIVYNNLKLT